MKPFLLGMAKRNERKDKESRFWTTRGKRKIEENNFWALAKMAANKVRAKKAKKKKNPGIVYFI
jgi:hypothetical protein